MSSGSSSPTKLKTVSSFADLPPLQFAPLDVPLARRRQTLAVTIYFLQIWIVLGLFLYLCTYRVLWPVIIPYLFYVYFDRSALRGAHGVSWLQNLFLWKWVAEFFPAKLVSEAPLDPTQTYIFGYHPHGILSTGAFLSFATEALGTSQLLPGLNIRLLTLISNFYVPLYRELLLCLNLASVSRDSILNILKKGPGNSVAIVIGGAQESLSAKPELVDLVLLKRYGFVKIAIQTGSSLVPVFSFGENNIFDQYTAPPGSKVDKIQRVAKKVLGFTFPLFHGRGVFTYNYGIFPKRHPMTIVVGKPIATKKDDNPSLEKVQAVHQKYLEALQDLYDRNKDQYSSQALPPPPMKFI